MATCRKVWLKFDRVYDQDNLSQTVYFEDTEGRQLHINLQMVTDKTAYDVIWDTELSDVTKTDISGNEAILVAKGEWAALMWLDDPFVLWVAGETGTGRADTDSGGDLYISKITFSIMRIFMK